MIKKISRLRLVGRNEKPVEKLVELPQSDSYLSRAVNDPEHYITNQPILFAIDGGKSTRRKWFKTVYQAGKDFVIREKKTFYIVSLALAAAGAGVSWLEASLLEKRLAPQEVNSVEDLNGDGTPDRIVRLDNGYLVPLYCLKHDPACVSGEQMARNPNNTIDYKALEEKINNGKIPVKF